ncbi:MAG TPA: PKD domain-containing protein [Ktedonobacterales bacterium]
MWSQSRDRDPERAPEPARASRRLGRLGAVGRSVVVAVFLAVSLMVGLALARPTPQSSLCACGLGASVTMVANGAPALAYAPPNDATDAPAGIFALDYYVNKPVTFYEDLSRMPSAPDPSSVQWRWNFGDGSAMSYQRKPTHTFIRTGTYTVVTSVYEPVSGQWGLFDNAIMHVIAAPFSNPPVAQARALTPTVITVGGKITFDATGSHAVTGTTLNESWNFGDNSVSSGSKVSHLFKQAGRGFVTLTVTDARGARAISQVGVVIIEPAQQAYVSASPTSAAVGASVSFDASKTTPPADQPVAVAWDFGDGSPLVTTSTPTVAHTYQKPGDYTVTVGVYGQLGDGGVTTVQARIVGATTSATAHTASAGPNWLLIGGAALVALLLLLAGVFFWLDRRKRAEAERQRRMAIELARARRVNGQPQRPRAPVGPRDPRREGPPRRERQPYPPDYDGRGRQGR